MSAKYLVLALMIPLLCSCTRASTLQEHKSKNFLELLEQGHTDLLQNTSQRAFTDGVENLRIDEKFTRDRLIDYIRINNLPSEDTFASEQAKNRKDYEVYQFFPMVLLNLSFNYPMFGYELQYYGEQDIWDRIYAYIGVTWNANFISRYRNLKKAETEQALAKVKQRLNQEQLTLLVVDMFYSIIERQKTIELRSKALELQQRSLQHVQDAAAASMYSLMDTKQALLRFAQLELDLAETRQELAALHASLQSLLELPPVHRLSLLYEQDILKQKPLDDWLQAALHNNTRLQLAQMAATSLRESGDAIPYERFSNFNMFIGLPQLTLRDRDETASRATYIGFNWSIPLFDAGETDFKLKENAIEKRKLALLVRKDISHIERVITNQYTECGHLQSRLKSLAAMAEQTRARHALLVELSGQGKIKYTEILQSEQEMMQAELEIFRTRLRLEYGYFKLRLHSGELSS